MPLIFTEPVKAEDSRKNVNWGDVLEQLQAKRGKWALVAVEDPTHCANSDAAILQRASWLRSKRFKDVAGFEAKVAFTQFGARGVFARVTR